MTAPTNAPEGMEDLRFRLAAGSALCRKDERNTIALLLDEASRIIAEKEAEVERWHSAYEIAHDQATANGSRAARLEEALREARVTMLAAIRSVGRDLADFDPERHSAIIAIDAALNHQETGQ